jgi:hypothetical protein
MTYANLEGNRIKMCDTTEIVWQDTKLFYTKARKVINPNRKRLKIGIVRTCKANYMYYNDFSEHCKEYIKYINNYS